MSRRILLLALGAVLLFVNARVFADSITHTQTTLGTELLTSLPSPPNNPTTTNFTITVTNGTTMTWDDYEILFITPLGGAFNMPNVVKIGNIVLVTNPFANGVILANNRNAGINGEKEAILQLTGGLLAPGASFTISLDLTYNNSVDVRGTPSVAALVPEPASMSLLGTGILGLLSVVRRKLQP